MEILANYPLKRLNSFGMAMTTHRFATFSSVDELLFLLQQKKEEGDAALPLLILGGGSNMLFRTNFPGWVLKNEIKGIEELHEDVDYVYVRAGAGENWHSFVQYCIDRGWGGLENLSLIPGNVGASPMQNIGAYGVEIKDVFWDLRALHIETGRVQTFTIGDCDFGYRESVFKTKFRNQYVILDVTYCLRKKPLLNTSYGAIQQELSAAGIQQPAIRDIANTVIHIRRSKLPDPAEIGNAGSFFKNPTISAEHFTRLQQTHPGIVGYPVPGQQVKLAAGWLIESAGWKGFREGDAGVHPKQALVLVNYGNASGADIYALSEKILHDIEAKFQVKLEREVNII